MHLLNSSPVEPGYLFCGLLSSASTPLQTCDSASWVATAGHILDVGNHANPTIRSSLSDQYLGEGHRSRQQWWILPAAVSYTHSQWVLPRARKRLSHKNAKYRFCAVAGHSLHGLENSWTWRHWERFRSWWCVRCGFERAGERCLSPGLWWMARTTQQCM